MTKINVLTLHEKIASAGILIDGVALNQDGTLRIDFNDNATAEQREQAVTIAKNYDQSVEDAAAQAKADKEASVIAALPEKAAVESAKTISALAEQVAKQGEMLALIAAKLGLI